MPGFGERTLADLIEALQAGKSAGRKILLLLGAGCSASAGVPLAADMVNIVRALHPLAYARAREKTYPHVLGALTSGERHSLVREVTKTAGLGWGHLAVAELLRAELVDRILTTNFDDLIEIAAVVAGVRLSVYDVPSAVKHDEERIAHPALFHLHGQAGGVVLLNTPGELDEQRQRIAPVVINSLLGRTVVVVGYSGENDPLVDLMVEHGTFAFGFYWLDHDQSDDPPSHLRALIGPTRQAFRVRGQSSDLALSRIATALGCFPARLARHPFSYLGDLLGKIGPLEDGPLGLVVDLLAPARAVVSWAIEKLEGEGVPLPSAPPEPSPEAIEAALAGDYCQALEIVRRDRATDPPTVLLEGRLAAMCGSSLFQRAMGTQGFDARQLLIQAEGHLAFASEHSPEDPVVQHNLANVRLHLADVEEPARALELRHEAEAGFRSALRIRPGYVRATRSLADCLVELADTLGPDGQRRIYQEALELYLQVIAVEPASLDSRLWLGQTRSNLARISAPEVAVGLLTDATQDFRAILEIDGEHFDALLWLSISLAQLSTIDVYPQRQAAGSEAEGIMKRIRAKTPDYPPNLTNMARLLLLRAADAGYGTAQGRRALQEAMAVCDELSTSDLVATTDPLVCTEIRMEVVRLKFADSDEGEAIAILNRMVDDLRAFLRARPDHYLAEAYLAMALGALGDARDDSGGMAALEEAGERMRKLVGRDPSDVGTRLNLASALVSMGKRSRGSGVQDRLDEAGSVLSAIPAGSRISDSVATLRFEIEELREQKRIEDGPGAAPSGEFPQR